MTEEIITSTEAPRSVQFSWIWRVLFTPRKAFAEIAAQNRGVWIIPILLLSITTLVLVLVAGPIKKAAAINEGPNLPPDFEFYSPEDQARFLQSAEATQGPVFMYVFPALLSLARVWFGWLLVGGILHLVMTMLGGRGSIGSTMNMVAWSGLPYAVRDLVRIVAMLITDQLVKSPGLAGFAPAGEAWYAVFLGKLMAYLDIYLIWNIVLLAISVRIATRLKLTKTLFGVLLTILLVLGLQALLGYLTTLLSGLTITRPFLF